MSTYNTGRRTVLKLLGIAGATLAGAVGGASGSSRRNEARVTLPNQKVDLDAATVDVRVAMANLPDGGFVVVHRDGDPFGGVAGHSEFLAPGVHTNVEIEVATDDVVDADGDGRRELVAMAHRDDGDRVYEFPDSDGPYLADGAPVIDTATIRDE